MTTERRDMAAREAGERRITKPAPPHNPLLAPGVCGCWECSRIVLTLRCPFTWKAGVWETELRCGNYRGHHGNHSALVASAFTDAAERVRLDGPKAPEVAP